MLGTLNKCIGDVDSVSVWKCFMPLCLIGRHWLIGLVLTFTTYTGGINEVDCIESLMIAYESKSTYLKWDISYSFLAIIDKHGVLISQWTWLYPALFKVSTNKIALWINVCADDWTAERAIIVSNGFFLNLGFIVRWTLVLLILSNFSFLSTSHAIKSSHAIYFVDSPWYRTQINAIGKTIKSLKRLFSFELINLASHMKWMDLKFPDFPTGSGS